VRLTLPHLLREIPHAVYHVDRGLIPTLKALARSPGKMIRGYLDGQRVRFFNPLTLLSLAASISALLFTTLPLDLAPFTADMPSDQAAKVRRMTELNFRYYGPSLLLYLPAQAAITWALFRTGARSYGEHLAVNAYLSAFGTVLVTVIGIPVLALAAWMQLPEAWVAGAFAVPLAYQAVGIYAVFASDYGRWASAWRATASLAIYLGALTAVSAAVVAYVRS
jgi:hypothetical protein